jgi:hypothetical protein
MRKLVGLTVLWMTLIGAILYGSPLNIFWDLSSFLYVYGVMLVFVLARFKISELKFLRNDIRSIFSEIGFGSLILAVLSAIILVLLQIKQPQKIGPPIAFGMLSSLYILINALSVLVLEKKNTSHTPSGSVKWSPTGFIIPAFVVLIIGILLRLESLLVDPISLIFMLGIILSVLLSRHDFKAIIDRSSEVGDTLISGSLLGGAAGTLIGLVQILQNMSDMSLVWGSVGSSLLTYLYGIIFAFVGYIFFPQSQFDIKGAMLSLFTVIGGILFFVLIHYAL